MDSEEKDRELRQASRRRFLKQGAMLAGFAAAGGLQRVSAQSAGAANPEGFGRTKPGWVDEKDIPPGAIVKDPWTGQPLRDGDGSLIVDWSGTPQLKEYNRRLQALGGRVHGARDKDWRLYGYRSRYVTSYRYGHQNDGPTSLATPTPAIYNPLEDQMGMITPSSLHYVNQHAKDPEDIDPKTWSVHIFGMVDRPMKVSLDDIIRRLPRVSRIHFVECNQNGGYHPARTATWARAGHIYGEASCSEWTGVLLSTLLEAAGVQKGASWLNVGSFEGVSDYTSVPLVKAYDDAMLAYGQNGEAVRPENGYPLRLLVPGFEGRRNIKRVQRLKVADEPANGIGEMSTGYTDVRKDGKVRWHRFEMPARTMILNPQVQMHGHGFHEIRGLAWSGGGKIAKVEVTTDGGKTWREAKLQEPILSKAMTNFVLPWQWNGEEALLASRCVDERGMVQPNLSQWSKATGHAVEDLRRPVGKPMPQWRFCVIQPWKISREGKVTNAIFDNNPFLDNGPARGTF